MTGTRTSKRVLQPRKQPKQARSRATVDAIVEAAAQVFECRGYAETTTDLVAERAGVSIGSLYQYFPSKDALLVALFERHLADAKEAFGAVLWHLEPTTELASFLRDYVHAALVLHRDSPRLHRVLMEEAPIPAGVRDRITRGTKRAANTIASYFRDLPQVQRDPDLAADLVIATIDMMCHRLTIYPFGGRPPEEMEEETVSMLLAYLTTSPSAESAPAADAT